MSVASCVYICFSICRFFGGFNFGFSRSMRWRPRNIMLVVARERQIDVWDGAWLRLHVLVCTCRWRIWSRTGSARRSQMMFPHACPSSAPSYICALPLIRFHVFVFIILSLLYVVDIETKVDQNTKICVDGRDHAWVSYLGWYVILRSSRYSI